MSLDQARKIIEGWRVDYNNSWMHRTLGDLAPAEFILQELSKIGQKLY